MSDIMSMREVGRSLETKFALDQELQFKINLHAQAMVAEWVAERIGLDPEQSQKFVMEIKEWGLRPGNRNLKARLLADFSANQIEISEHALERLIDLKNQQARKKFIAS